MLATWFCNFGVCLCYSDDYFQLLERWFIVYWLCFVGNFVFPGGTISGISFPADVLGRLDCYVAIWCYGCIADVYCGLYCFRFVGIVYFVFVYWIHSCCLGILVFCIVIMW